MPKQFKTKRWLCAGLGAWLFGGSVAAGAAATGLSEAAVARFTTGDIDGQIHAAAEAGAAATVWVFVSHDCPICNSYAPELNRLRTELAERAVRVNLVYTDAELSIEALRNHAKEHGYSGALFDDADHRLAKACGIAVTPEVIVVGPDQVIGYRGRIDNRYLQPGRERALTTSFDLRVALEAVLDHRPVPNARTDAVGCALESP